MALTKITRGVIKANENYDTHNINSTGIVTAVSANFTGDVSIGGTLTYQDVTNIDSVGIITAQSDISIADKIVHTGDTNTALRFPAADTITAETGGTERLRINSAGNLGVGNASPTQARLVAQTASGMSIAAVKDNTGASISLGGVTQPRILMEAGASASEFKLYTAGGSSYGSAGWVQRIHVASNGNIGLAGQTSPSAQLHINNLGSDGYELKLTGNALQFNRSSNSYIDQLNDTGKILFRMTSSNTEAMRIDSAGRVMIGTQTPGPTAGEQLTIADSANAGITIRSGTNAGGAILFEDDTADRGEIQYSHNGDYMRFKTTGTERLRISSGGFFNFNQANNNNLQGRVTIFDGGNFSTNSILGSGDSDNIYLISDASSGYNVYGSSIAWSRVQYADRRVAAIANVQTSTDEDHVGLAFFTHPSADATAAIEEKFRITHDGIHITNGVSNFYVAFRLANNQSYNWDIAVPNEGGYGNSFRCECGYNHYYTAAYGAHRSAWISTRGTSSNNMFDQDQSHSQSGYWTFSKPNNTTFRVTKTAGTYGGQGYGFVHVRFNYF
jgi:hypothetical protein